MPVFTPSDDMQGAKFVGVNLRDARFVRADLSGVVMRGVDVQGRTLTPLGSWVAIVPCSSTASTWSHSSTPSSTAAFPAAPTGKPPIRMACAPHGPRSNAPG